jgi:hypothetical protein
MKMPLRTSLPLMGAKRLLFVELRIWLRGVDLNHRLLGYERQ